MSILTTLPEGARVLDLDAARAARAEARAAAGDGPPYVKVAAGYIAMRPEMDLEAGEDFMAGKLREGLAKMLADPADLDALLADGFSKDDLNAIGEYVTGASLGESSAS